MLFMLILRRILVAIPTILLVSLMTFTLLNMLDGDPVLTLAGEERDPAVLEALRDKYRLNDPLPIRYVTWLKSAALEGDLGMSYRTELPVREMIAQKLPITIQLALMAIVLALVIGVPLGIISAVYKGRFIDYFVNLIALSGMSIPNFFLGILLMMVFAVQLNWLPSSGYVPFSESPWESLRAMFMPALVLSSAIAAYMLRHTRSAMLGVLRADYIRTAKAKGLSAPVVILKHALRNALIPIITVTTLLLGEMLAGAVLTEQIFSIPGFGKMTVDAVFNREYAVVQGVVMFTALGFILMNLLADVLYILVNPRLRYAQ